MRWPEGDAEATFPATPGIERMLLPQNREASPTNLLRIRVIRYVPDFVMDMTTREVASRSSAPDNPAILVAVGEGARTNEYWLFAKHPEFNMPAGGGHGGPRNPLQMVYLAADAGAPSGPIKAFRSTITILEAGHPVRERTVAVNAPSSYKHYTFYQSGYNPADPSWTSLQVVRDPGVPVVYTGFALLIVGLFAVFYLYGRNGAAEGPAA